MAGKNIFLPQIFLPLVLGGKRTKLVYAALPDRSCWLNETQEQPPQPLAATRPFLCAPSSIYMAAFQVVSRSRLHRALNCILNHPSAEASSNVRSSIGSVVHKSKITKMPDPDVNSLDPREASLLI